MGGSRESKKRALLRYASVPAAALLIFTGVCAGLRSAYGSHNTCHASQIPLFWVAAGCAAAAGVAAAVLTRMARRGLVVSGLAGVVTGVFTAGMLAVAWFVVIFIAWDCYR